MNATADTFRITTDAWTLRAMRDAKAFRAANPDPEHADADAYLDRYLAACEEAAAALGTVEERPVADEPAAARRSGSGFTARGEDRNAPTDAQLRFLASLARDLGYELQTPRDKSHASLIIDGAKKALDRMRREGTAPAAAVARPATDAQISYLRSLVAERETDVDPERADEITPETTSFALASQLITLFQTKPRRAKAVPAHGIREGRYAYSPDGGTTADHYRVRRDGKIVVWTAGGEYPYNGKLNEGLEWIKANPREAAVLFGQLTETCGRCGRDLSDDDSRARGLGPDCATKSEW